MLVPVLQLISPVCKTVHPLGKMLTLRFGAAFSQVAGSVTLTVFIQCAHLRTQKPAVALSMTCTYAYVAQYTVTANLLPSTTLPPPLPWPALLLAGTVPTCGGRGGRLLTFSSLSCAPCWAKKYIPSILHSSLKRPNALCSAFGRRICRSPA
jgi:hypothetical protein